MRPIIEYHGPLFQWLHRVVFRIGHDNTLLLWQSGAILWLLILCSLTRTRRFPRLFTGLMLIGIVLLRLPGLGLVEQNVDESQWIASAATLVDDPRFWQSVDGTTSGPLNVWPPALLYYLGLSLDYSTLRLWGLLTCVLPTAWLLLATCRLRFSERLSRLAMLPVVACLALATDPDAVAFNSEQLPMTLLALAGYLLSRIFTPDLRNRVKSWGWLVALGVVLGCLPYTKLQTTPIGLAIAAWVLAGLFMDQTETGRQRLWRVGGFVAGGLLPTVVVGGYLLATGLTDYAFRSYILINLEYAQSGSWEAGTVSWADRLRIRLPQIYGQMRTTNWFWRLALLLVIAGLCQIRLHSLIRWHSDPQRWFAVSICLVSLYAILQPGNPFSHYQWLSFVPVSWLIGQLISRLLTSRRADLNRRLAWATGIGYVLLCVAYPGWLVLRLPNPGIDQLESGGWHSTTWAVSEAIRPYARPNAKLVVWGWANGLHVETGLLMGSRFIPLYFPVVPGPQQAYLLSVYQRDLLVNRPAIIVDAVRLRTIGDYTAYPIRRYPSIQRVLDTRYQLVRTVDEAKIYALRP